MATKTGVLMMKTTAKRSAVKRTASTKALSH